VDGSRRRRAIDAQQLSHQFAACLEQPLATDDCLLRTEHLRSGHSFKISIASRSASSRRSGTLALGAPKGFQLGFKRRPISAVFGLFDAGFGIERFAQDLALARKSQVEQRAAAGLRASLVGETPDTPG
jgi:hypothetical protein